MGETSSSVGEEAELPYKYAGVYEWVDEFFLPVFKRRIDASHRWCAKWWAHEEAYFRLECLWRTWEEACHEKNGVAYWTRDHLDHHLEVLMSPHGPFSSCSVSSHESILAMPSDKPPRIVEDK